MKMKKYIYILGLAITALISACEDQSTELTSIDYDRLFSPISLEARVINQVNVRLSWSAVNGATSYNIEVFANDSLTFTGTPVRILSGISNTDIPYTITGLEGETK